ncbi:MAG: ROK family protein [Sphingomonadales bacterium]|nr:ROK family protein [Sphingomonadales bacterium]
MSAAHYALVEAGGTKFVLGLADAGGTILARHRVETTTPEATLGASIAWLREQRVALAAVGIAAFGPLDLDRASTTYGHIRTTPKPHWTGADFVTPFAEAFACPVGLDTDVNAAALAEQRWGAGKGHGSLLYLTVGTGIGGGFVSDGRLLHGLTHPEMGHMRVPRHGDDHGFAGACPFHGACIEGLACGPAIKARWGASLTELGADHPANAMIAWYLGRALANFQAVLEPACIVLGGGVMATAGLLERVRAEAVAASAGYFLGDPAKIIVPPGLGTDSGLRGALALALSSIAEPAAAVA